MRPTASQRQEVEEGNVVNFSEMDAATLTEVLKGSAKDREEEEDVRSFVHVAAANGRQVLLELF